MILRVRKEWVSIGALVLMMALAACTSQEDETSQVSTFQNPIFPGDYPDPSVLRDGDDYYIVHSSFEYYPGLLIWHSKDLLNWTPVTNALTKYVGSVWAPELVKYEDRYYIYFPASNTNYVIWSDAIDGPWSEPIQLDVTMIDPGHVADSEGNRYLYFSSGSYVPLSKDGLSITGDVQHVYYGWPIPREWSIECFCMEGPKLFKRGEYYYLTVAEGGTAGPATGHMVISARSKSPLGPWENAPNNPILRAESSEETWWSVGHGTVLDDAEGNWWMIFHGYEKDHYNMGRQTMMVPIEWTEDDWYRIPEGVDITQPIRLPDNRRQHTNSSFTDPFEEGQLNLQWKFFEGYDQNRVELETQGILIKGKGTSVAGSSPMLYIPSDHDYTVEVELEIQGNATGGLLLFYNNSAFSGILADQANVLANLRGWQFVTEEQVIDRHVFLRLKNESNTVDMYYSTDGTDWIKIENSFESSGYHHNILSGFMSLRIGLTALGDGKVKFSNFKYHPLKP